MSILKPLAGEDDDLRGNLESFVGLVDHDYELLLGVASADDPAWEIARAFLGDHPDFPARLVLTDPDAARNPKVAQLICLEQHAAGDIIIISDSNVRVAPDYLRNLIGSFSDPTVGLVSNVIVGTSEWTSTAWLENLLLATHVAPGVLVSSLVMRQPITVGKSMALTRQALDAAGGLASVANVLAEDHALARRCRAAGYRVRLCLSPVENRNASGGWRRSFDRHTRWARIRRAMAPAGFLFEPVVQPALLAGIALCCVRTLPAFIAFLVACAGQMLLTRWCTTFLGKSPLPYRYLPLDLLRGGLLLVCWARGWNTRIVWRGNHLRIGRNTVLKPRRRARLSSSGLDGPILDGHSLDTQDAHKAIKA